MLLQMHFSPRRGYLEHSSGQPYSTEDISRMIGIREKKVQNLLTEMEEKFGTFSRDENGVIFNRRMVRDTAISKIRKEAGSKGGNPALGNLDNQNPPDVPNLDNQSSNQNASKSDTPRAGAKPSPIPLPSPSKDPLEENTISPDGEGQSISLFVLAPPAPVLTNGALATQQKTWFASWWAIYWRRVAPGPAEKAFKKHVKTSQRFAEVMGATEQQTPTMMLREPGYRPHGASWLNAERWKDERSQPARAAPQRSSSLVERTEALWAARIAKGESPI